MIIQRIGGTTTTPRTSKKVIQRINVGPALQKQAPTPITEITEPIQITPGQKKIDVIPNIKYVSETIIKGIKLTLQDVAQIKPPAKLPAAKEVFSKENVIKSFKEAVKATPTGALTRGAIDQAKFNVDVISGIVGAWSKDPGTTTPEGGFTPTQFVPKNKNQAIGVVAYDFIKYGYAFEAGGINAAFEGATKSLTATPKFQFVAAVVKESVDKKITLLLNKIKPLKLTIQDLSDVTKGVGTPEQVARFNQAMKLKENGLPIRDILAASKKAKVSPSTKLYDFLKDSIESVIKGFKSSLTPQEQKLLTAGGKSEIEKVIVPGEYSSQELVGKIIANKLEKTPEGKQIVKLALEAQQKGQNIVVSSAGKVSEVPPTEKPPAESITEAPEAKKPVVEAPKLTEKVAKPTLPTEIKGVGKVKPKTVSVPREQLPVGEGKKQISRLEARVKETLKNVPQEKIDELGLPTYKQMNKEENIFKATEYVFNNPEEALQVLSGEIEAPKGILRNSIYLAMEKYAKGDVDLARRLASLESTRLGQEISILTELDPYSPVKIMRDIIKVRAKATERKYAGRDIKEVTKKQVQKGEAMIKPPTRFEWATVIERVRC